MPPAHLARHPIATPQTIRVDNGPEFISRSLDLWAYSSGVKLDFSRPGKPTDNAFIESFNGRLRDECLNQHWFLSLDEARAVAEAWRDDYNRVRPHGALGNQTPFEFARLNTRLVPSWGQRQPPQILSLGLVPFKGGRSLLLLDCLLCRLTAGHTEA